MGAGFGFAQSTDHQIFTVALKCGLGELLAAGVIAYHEVVIALINMQAEVWDMVAVSGVIRTFHGIKPEYKELAIGLVGGVDGAGVVAQAKPNKQRIARERLGQRAANGIITIAGTTYDLDGFRTRNAGGFPCRH